MLNDAHHTPSNDAGPARATHDRHAQPAPRPRRDTAFSHDSGVKSATRALEVIELFAVRREALSVSEIAGALEIPQSSSSVLLQAMRKAGFIDRNRQTRKYLPSIRSVFLGNWIHDTLFQRGSFLRALDTLSDATGANVRLGVRNGIHVRYAHISWPGGHPDLTHLRPGMLIPICQDALGRMLLVGAGEREARGIVRHANADARPTSRRSMSRISWRRCPSAVAMATPNASTSRRPANAFLPCSFRLPLASPPQSASAWRRRGW